MRYSMFAAALSCMFLAKAVDAGVGVTTWHGDLLRTGQNLAETRLTPATVAGGSFGKLCAHAVDGQVYAQPLVAPGVSAKGAARDLVFVATEHDSVYAFDADCAQPGPIWKTSFLGPGITTMPCVKNNQPQCDLTVLAPERGITGTPVVDLGAQTLFVAAQSVDHGVYTQSLHALDIRTGRERPGSPVVIAARSGMPPGKRFNSTEAVQRSGLLLLAGVVYVPFASNDSANGWLIGYDAASLVQRAVFCVTPQGSLGGVWGGGAAPAVDGAGRIIFGTGNGSFDADTGGSDYGMSVVRLAAGSGSPKVVDYFTPSHERGLSQRDLDLDSGGVMLLPEQPGRHPREAVTGFKTGSLFLLDRDNLGHLGDAGAIQILTANRGGIYSTPAYWRGSVYLAGVGGSLRQWVLVDGAFPSTPTHESRASFNYPGATPTISANGARDGVVWAIATDGKVQGGRPAVLRAFDARDVSRQLYDSAAEKRDPGGPGVKFSVPTVANGQVFVGTQTELDVYGLR